MSHPRPGDRVRIVVEGILADEGDVVHAAIIGDHPDCLPLVDPKLVNYARIPAGDVYPPNPAETNALCDVVRATLDHAAASWHESDEIDSHVAVARTREALRNAVLAYASVSDSLERVEQPETAGAGEGI